MIPPVAQATQFLQWLQDGEPFELCLIGPKTPTSRLWEGRANGKSVVAGWFTDAELAARIACQVEATGVYVTLNPTKDALLSRAESRLKAGVNRTGDNSIARLRNILIDLDPIREQGISSTDLEHQAALDMAQIIRADLAREGWPEALYGDSGNGAHLIYPVELPNTPESVALVKSILEVLALRYADELKQGGLELDKKVSNPARLTKLYGTWVRKGDNTQARPHRLSQVLHFPTERRPVSVELLPKLAGEVPKEPSKTAPGGDSGQFDMRAYLAHYGVEVIKDKSHHGGTLYCLQECLFDPEHSGNEAAIGQAADGKLFYQCFHNSCKGRTWAEARRIISGDEKLGQFMAGGASRTRSSASIKEHEFSRPLYDLKSKAEEALRKGNLTDDEIAYVLNLIDKPAPEKSIAQEVRDWVMTSTGFFLTSELFIELNLTSRDFKKAATLELLRLKKAGTLEPCGDKRGCYRRVEKDVEELRWWEADIDLPFDVSLPFDLHRQVNIFPRNIIVVAGATNAGKTAFLLNAALQNMYHAKVNYFTSEMPLEEIKLRLSLFEEVGLVSKIDEWRKVTFKERVHNFHQVIEPDAINIIDYLELTDQFYKVAEDINAIYTKLNKGIAIIGLQKEKGAEWGIGGKFTAFRSRLYIALDDGRLKIIKAKNWSKQTIENPVGQVFTFKLWKGAKFIIAGQ